MREFWKYCDIYWKSLVLANCVVGIFIVGHFELFGHCQDARRDTVQEWPQVLQYKMKAEFRKLGAEKRGRASYDSKLGIYGPSSRVARFAIAIS